MFGHLYQQAIAPYLRTNIPPSDDDTKQFSLLLNTASHEEKKLEQEIIYLEISLRNRRAELIQAKEVIRDHRIVLSPVRRVPTEILLEIFSEVCDQPVDVLDLSRGIWPLSQVCRFWRQTVLDHKPFWTNVHLPRRIDYPQYAVHILTLFQERSASLPLTVDFACKDASEFTRAILGVLMSQSNRWTTCHLSIPVQLLARLSSTSVRRVDLMHHLDITLDLPFASQVVGLHDLFSEAHALRSVRLTGFPIITTTLRLPWSQLTKYEAYQDFPENHLSILRLTPNLVECTLDSSRTWHREPPITDAQRLTNLRRLTLTGHAGLLLKFLTAPALRALHIENHNEEDLIKNFIIRSSCHLREFGMETDVLDNEVLTILKTTPFLKNLNLNVAVPRQRLAFRDLLLALVYSSELSQCILPRLEGLRISVYHASDESLHADVLTQMVASRWKLPVDSEAHKDLKRLKSFILETNSDWLPAFDYLKDLRDEGLEVTLSLH